MTESVTEQWNQEVSVEQLSEVQRKLAVEIPWDRVKGKLDEAYQELGRGVTIKGFRRGKVPRRLLQQMFGQHVNREVAQQLVQESIAKAVSENDLSPIAEPEVEQGDIVDGEAFRYSAVLQVIPQVEPKDYFGLDVPRRPAKADEQDVERALLQKQREAIEYNPVEGRETRAGDVLLVDLMGKVGDEPLSLESELVELGGEVPREPIPGLSAKLTGIPVDQEELEIELEVPGAPPAEGEGGETVPMRQARLLVTIKDVKEKSVPTLDDEFAKDTGEADTLDELKGKLREKLLEADEERALQEAKDKLTEMLVERNDVPLVPALVERQVEQMAQFQQILFGGGQPMPEELKERMRPEAERTVRAALLVRAIGKKENVEVEEADVEKRLAQMAAARGQSVAKVRSEYQKEGRLDQLRESIREEKTLDLLVSKSNLFIQESADEPDAVPAHGDGASEQG